MKPLQREQPSKAAHHVMSFPPPLRGSVRAPPSVRPSHTHHLKHVSFWGMFCMTWLSNPSTVQPPTSPRVRPRAAPRPSDLGKDPARVCDPFLVALVAAILLLRNRIILLHRCHQRKGDAGGADRGARRLERSRDGGGASEEGPHVNHCLAQVVGVSRLAVQSLVEPRVPLVALLQALLVRLLGVVRQSLHQDPRPLDGKAARDQRASDGLWHQGVGEGGVADVGEAGGEHECV
mmetsp:Transcript_22262/g.54174  ORF Transcript_22262/g.54174 Transcript_22262/m.54174 type:complete len:234 (+) Transcript_22262:282-983(+)